MTLTCTDTCCINNLINGGAVDTVVATTHRRLCVEGLVHDEVIQNREQLEKLIASGAIGEIPGGEILASEVGKVAEKYNIGLGEAECIAIGKKKNVAVASDDLRARRAAVEELGRSSVTGTLGLLREAVAKQGMTPEQAFAAYNLMVANGAYLPKVPNAQFFAETA
jgi:predicted nucleic acid-binding protein